MTQFQPLPFEPGYRRVADAITARILDRSLRAGDRLPPEAELAQQFAVNRSTIREALRELESVHLLARRRGSKCMVVSRPEADQIAGRVGQSLALHDVTIREVWQTLELIQPAIAEQAARHADGAAIEALRAAVDTYRADHATAQAAVAGVAGFFRAVAAASGNRVLGITQEPLLLLLGAALQVMIDRAPPARERIRVAQRRILDAITAHDATLTREWMGKHVRDFRRGFEVSGLDVDAPVPAPRRD
jgi:GntR family transcriptional repressor for pyruvate dehydrogenase complex